MSNLIALDNRIHQTLTINPQAVEQHGQSLHLVPIVVSECTAVASQFPIVLSKNEETGQFSLGAMLGFEAGENLFWYANRWQGLYLPLQIQRQPFFLGEAAQNSEQEFVVCFDAKSPCVNDDSQSNESAQAVFNADGTETDYLIQAKQCLAELLRGEQDNAQLIANLVNYELIQPMSLEITFVDQKSRRLNGLYTINKDKLAELSKDTVYELYQNGQLEVMYAMTASLGQLYRLIELKNSRLS